MRQKDQTKKAPTGTFQRDNLLAHLEKQAKEHPDKEDLVPFTGEKRGESAFSRSRDEKVAFVWLEVPFLSSEQMMRTLDVNTVLFP